VYRQFLAALGDAPLLDVDGTLAKDVLAKGLTRTSEKARNTAAVVLRGHTHEAPLLRADDRCRYSVRRVESANDCITILAAKRTILHRREHAQGSHSSVCVAVSGVVATHVQDAWEPVWSVHARCHLQPAREVP
jgi:hypothetical protein